jgi:hypothetical protein
MKNLFRKHLLLAALTVSITLSNIPLFAQTANKQLTLRYKFPEDRSVTYKQTSKMMQIMDIEGQQMQNEINSLFGCSVKSAGGSGPDLALEIRIDTLAQSVESPMGGSGGGISGVSGKIFRMVITPQGKETDITGAAKVVYEVPSSATSDLSSVMIDFFPDLPAGPVSQGYKWNATDSVNTGSEATSMRLLTNSENLIEGNEKVNGYDCIKIISNVSGTQTINTVSQDMHIKMSGPFTGTYTLYFSTDEGYFIKSLAETKLKGTLKISELDMTMPVQMDVSTVTDLVE